MSIPDDCSISGCKYKAAHLKDEMEKEYGVPIALCDTCYRQYRNKLRGGMLANAGNTAGTNMSMLNIGGVINNMLGKLITPDKATHLSAMIGIRTGKDQGNKLNALIQSATKQTIDLMPTGSLNAKIVQTPWWESFFEIVGINNPQNKVEVLGYVNERIFGISEADESKTGRFGQFAQKVADVFSTKPTGKAGRQKNSYVASLAVNAAANIYDRLLETALAKEGLSITDLPKVYEIFRTAILPTLSSTGGYSVNDAQRVAAGDGRYYQDILKAYEAYQQISNALINSDL